MWRPSLLEPREAYALWAADYPPHAHNAVMRAEERAMLALMPPDLGGRTVLDVGCGSGRYLLHGLHRDAAHLTGVDLSPEMLRRAAHEFSRCGARAELLQGEITALPVPDASADLTICALTIGHVETLQTAVAELHRATRPGGCILCSDVHPIGHALGWLRDFKSGGAHYAVRHTAHLYSHWHAACADAGLHIDTVLEPMLDPDDIPAAAHFDKRALEIPVALVFRLLRPL